jgi:acetylornithine deacetylase/succinyl-diaminopimelate desuccinylase-like protein
MSTKKIIIAIDGFSSCGKSTLAKRLATQLSYTFIDTGAMYRAITLYFLRNSVDLSNQQSIEEALKNIELHFEINAHTKQSEIFLNGENVAQLIREMLVADKVSEVAAKAIQTTFGKEPIPTRGGGSIPIIALFEKILGLKTVLMGFGLDNDNIHSPNEKYDVANYFKGIETIPYFHKYFAE